MQIKLLGIQGSDSYELVNSVTRNLDKTALIDALEKSGLTKEGRANILVDRGICETMDEANGLLDQFARKAENASGKSAKLSQQIGAFGKGLLKSPATWIALASVAYGVCQKISNLDAERAQKAQDDYENQKKITEESPECFTHSRVLHRKKPN